MRICLRIVNQVGHIIKAFLNSKITTGSLGANVALRGPIQGTIRSETENGMIYEIFYFSYYSFILFY